MKAVSILTCGADPTAQRLSTSAIQQAINTAQQNDVIVIPQGRFLTGALFLKSGVSLRLDAGAQLVGSQDLADYPLINTRVAGIDMRWPAGIINIIDCENVSVRELQAKKSGAYREERDKNTGIETDLS
ncbi:hypothetical protein [Enterobacter hormaechei]|uniref:hypothetical protein n=1 Tax=Enterobacter hormaechei TaxID=158836 RepID=UPI001CEF9AE7|nr:hypothetical protein [Enterobacter hormaechei]